jgi:hypothetical protein
MNSAQDRAGGRPLTVQRHQVQASEERDDSHYSFLQGTPVTYIVINHYSEWLYIDNAQSIFVVVFSKERIESITTYKNQRRSGKNFMTFNLLNHLL